MEVAPGIHRIEGDLGERYVCQYLLVGEERTLLVDTGLRDMPAEVIAPYVALTEIDDVLISHADVDHCGGNRALRAARAAARGSSAARPTARGSSPTPRCWPATTAGTRPTASARRPTTSRSSSASWAATRRSTSACAAARRCASGPSWRVEVLALPGHTPGHLGLWDPRSGAAIVIDAVLSDGVYDRAGNRLIPPRYYSARRLRGDDPARCARSIPALLLTAHYDVMERDAAREFLDRSLAFVHAVRDAVRARDDDRALAAHAGGRRRGRPVPGLHARARRVRARAPGRGLSFRAARGR